MIDIINKYTLAVLYHSETADSIAVAMAESLKNNANLSGADLSGANLRRANLRWANLSGAYLSGADLSGAYLSGAKGLLPNGITPLQILGTRNALIVREVGHITIGCEHHPVSWWEKHYRAIGRKENYTPAQINEYRNYIAMAQYWMKLYGVLEVKQEATPDAAA